MDSPVILFDNRFSDGTPTATDEAAGYSVLNITDLRPYTFWQAATPGTKHLTVDCGTPQTADCIGLIGHNLYSAGAGVAVQASSDNFVSDVNDVMAFMPSNDLAQLHEARLGVNGNFDVWRNGAAAAPDAFSLTGAGATVARDEVIFVNGSYGAALTYGSAVAGLRNDSLMAYLSQLQGVTIGIGCWAKTSVPNQARIIINDTAGTSASAFHTGSGQWEWLAITRTVDGAATWLNPILRVEAAGTAYFDGLVVKIGSSDPLPTDVSDYAPPGALLKRYWRVKLSNATVAPRVAVAMVGNQLKFPYPPAAPYSPYRESVKGESRRSKAGHPLGAVVRYRPREITAHFTDLTRDFVFNTFQPFWDGHASDLKPFFYADDLTTFPSNVFYVKMKDGAVFETPLARGGRVESITLDMEGVRE